MKRYAAKVTSKGKRAKKFETLAEAYVWAMRHGGKVWRAAGRTKDGGWVQVDEISPASMTTPG